MKIKLFVVLLLFLGTLKVRAQSTDTDIAYQIVNALRGQNYDSLQSFISPVTENPILAGAVFMSGPARSFLQAMENRSKRQEKCNYKDLSKTKSFLY